MEVVMAYVKELLGQWPAEITLVSFMNTCPRVGTSFIHVTSILTCSLRYLCQSLLIRSFFSWPSENWNLIQQQMLIGGGIKRRSTKCPSEGRHSFWKLFPSKWWTVEMLQAVCEREAAKHKIVVLSFPQQWCSSQSVKDNASSLLVIKWGITVVPDLNRLES